LNTSRVKTHLSRKSQGVSCILLEGVERQLNRKQLIYSSFIHQTSLTN